MIIKDSRIHKTVFNKAELIVDDVPKIVVVGRSNVGKSSLINKLLNRRSLAKSSSRPGKTVSINYYLINEHFYFVDLPGYGYAKISKTEKRRVEKLISDFYHVADHRVKLILLLIDSRRGFLESDLELLSKIVAENYKILTILTKSDKIKSSILNKQLDILRNNYDLLAIPFSIKNDSGKEKILSIIEEVVKE